jgi:hypothetical protein
MRCLFRSGLCALGKELSNGVERDGSEREGNESRCGLLDFGCGLTMCTVR